jgi:hypothetical protein
MNITADIANGVKLFVQLTSLRSDPLESKWVRDEEDLRLALEQVAESFKYTKGMLGKKMYRNEPTFNYVEDVKRDMEEILLRGETDRERAGMRKRNLTMYHIVIEPVIEALGALSHIDAINKAEEFTRSVYDYAVSANINTHFDDAIVAKSIVSGMVRAREEARKTAVAAKRKRGRKKKEDELLLQEVKETDSLDLE